MSTERFPDIEIYVMDRSVEEILAWLGALMTQTEPPHPQGSVIKATFQYQENSIPVTLTPQAAGKKFTSVIFDSDLTPWATDLDCARDAFQALQTEVRCSAGGWVEEEEEDAPETWWRLTEQGEKKINWRG